MATYVETSTNKWEMKEGHLLDTEITRLKFRHILGKTRAKRIFEIGFNGGHSARLWLELGAEHVHSIDICKHEYTEDIARELEKTDSRFTFTKIDSNDLDEEALEGYDLLFIDGDHDPETVRNDLLLGAGAGIGYMLIDDYNFPNTPQEARVGPIVNSIVGDLGFRYCFWGRALHYDCSHGPNKMRLTIAYTHWKHHSDHSEFKKQ